MCICIREEGPKVGVSSGRGNQENSSCWAFTPGAISGLFSFIHQIFMWHRLCSGHYGRCCGIKWPINLAKCCNETPWQVLREMALLNISPPGGQEQEPPQTHLTKFLPRIYMHPEVQEATTKRLRRLLSLLIKRNTPLLHYYFVFEVSDNL